MRLDALTKAGEIQEAIDRLTTHLIAGSILFERHKVGYQGGQEVVSVYWRRAEQFWFHSDVQPTRYRCWYGVQNPETTANLSISCEINPPLAGMDWSCAGAFARDRSGIVHYLRTERLGGTRINKVAKRYFNAHGGPWADVWWPNGKHRDMILLGALDDAALIQNIAKFVQRVERFKENAE